MAFSQASIVGEPVCSAVNRHLKVAWTSTAPAGTLFQVYLDHRLAWSGTARSALFPLPAERVDVEVGTVGPGEGAVDYSGALPAAAMDRARLEWDGDPTAAAFLVYGSAVAGGPVDYSAPLARVPATVAGVDLPGFGMGGYGTGSWGAASGSYSWTSKRLRSGVWSFGVVAVDAAGNAGGAPATASVTIVAPPGPPAEGVGGRRLRYTYDAATGVPTLYWLAPV